jgi:hypothetical protein
MFSPLVLDPLSTIFSPVVLDPMRRGIGRTIKIDPTDSLLLTGIGGGQQSSQTVLGMRGIELRKGSGEQGYFEVRIVRAAPRGADYWCTEFGLANLDMCFGKPLGWRRRCLGWTQHGVIGNGLVGTADHCNIRDDCMFTTGDVVGLMVDCTAEPTLRFFVNGVQVHRVVVAQEGYGLVLFPVFSFTKWTGQIHIASNPDFPSFSHESW